MFWNYRVVKTSKGFSIYEIYYNDNGDYIGRTEDPVLNFFCPTSEGVFEEIDIIKSAFERPIFEENED